MIRLVEHLPNVNPDPIGVPDAVLMRPTVIAVLDGVKGEVTVVAPAWVGSGLSARAAYAQAAERVMGSISGFIEKRLRLVVNQDKSQVARSDRVKFLGMTIVGNALAISHKGCKRP